jgi:DNA-binding Lrp family transcriptional regulator
MYSVDAVDLKILAELSSDARASFVEIGRKLDLHPNVVAYRVNKLKQAGIIKRYVVELDFEKLGLPEQVYIAGTVGNRSDRDNVLKQIATIPQAVKVTSFLGTPETLVFFVGKNKSEVDMIISKMKELDIKIEYTASVVRSYEQGQMSEFLRQLANEAGEKRNSSAWVATQT